MKISYKEFILGFLTAAVGLIAVLGLAAPLVHSIDSTMFFTESGFDFMAFDSKVLIGEYDRFYVYIWGALFFTQCLIGAATAVLGVLYVFFPRIKKSRT